MTSKQLSKFIGREGAYRIGPLTFHVMILDAKAQFGRVDLLITPMKGVGEQWVSNKTVGLNVPRGT